MRPYVWQIVQVGLLRLQSVPLNADISAILGLSISMMDDIMQQTLPLVTRLGGEQFVSMPCGYEIYWRGSDAPEHIIIDFSQWVPLVGVWVYNGEPPADLMQALEQQFDRYHLTQLLPDELNELDGLRLTQRILSRSQDSLGPG